MFKRLSLNDVIYYSGESDFVSFYLTKQKDLKNAMTQVSSSLNEMQSLLKSNKKAAAINLVNMIETEKNRIVDMSLVSSVGIFCSDNIFGFVELKSLDKTFATIADSFHIKPLLKEKQIQKEFYILSISGVAIKLFLVGDDGINLVETKVVETEDKAKKNHMVLKEIKNIVQEYLHISQVPLILAGSKPNVTEYESFVNYPYVLEEKIYCQPEKIALEELLVKADVLINKYLEIRFEKVLEDIQFCHKSKKSLSNFEEIYRAAMNGQVENLVIAEDYHLWGEVNSSDRSFRYYSHQQNEKDDDLLDDLSELVLKMKGKVWLMPKKRIQSDLMATLRW